jgi:light-regulated signal transduction histidine kinase (bacteriophytochrome)
VKRKDGTEFPVEISLSFIETNCGNFSLGLANDFAQRKRAADNLARMKAELQRSEAELEHFAAFLSHDLQEPLRVIANYLNLLTLQCGDQMDSDARRSIDQIVAGVARVKSLIHEVLAAPDHLADRARR